MNSLQLHMQSSSESIVPLLNQQPKKDRKKKKKIPNFSGLSTQISLRQYDLNVGESSVTTESKRGRRPYWKKVVPVARDAVTRSMVVHPCTECGKRFCSWKALFGHMRCHPERQWRGINPPLNIHRPILAPSSAVPRDPHPETAASRVIMEEEEVARCLLMLSCSVDGGGGDRVGGSPHPLVSRRKLSSLSPDPPQPACNKASGSQRSVDGAMGHDGNDHNEKMNDIDQHGKMTMLMGHHHKCNVCMRVFSSGQALGVHIRDHHNHNQHHHHQQPKGRDSNLDLNLPASLDMEDLTDGAGLDLKLGNGLELDQNYFDGERAKEHDIQRWLLLGASAYS